MRFPRTALWLLLVILSLVACAIFRDSELTWLGGLLVDSQNPVHADMIEVLGGDLRGNRILTAAKLVREGYAPLILVSGGGDLYGQHESDLAVAFAVRNGCDEKWFAKLRYPAQSTRDEAHAVIQEFRRRGVKSYLLVTSDFHTRRAETVFRHEAPYLPFRVIAAPDDYFAPGRWWKSREGEKTFADEWAKTVANWLGV